MKFIKTFLYLSIIIFACYFQTQAQGTVRSGMDAELNSADLARMGTESVARVFDNRYQGVTGSPFLYEEWSEGTLTLSALQQEEIKYNVKIQYDIQTEEVIVRLPSTNQVVIIEPSKIIEFTVASALSPAADRFIPTSAIMPGSSVDLGKFVEILSEGKTKLLKNHEIEFIKADYQGAFSSATTTDEYIKKSKLYILKEGENKPKEIKPRKKDILKALSDKSSEVEKFLSSNKIKLKSETDLKKVIDYYNSLNS